MTHSGGVGVDSAVRSLTYDAIAISATLTAGGCALNALVFAVPDEGRPLWAFLLTERSRIN